MFLCATDAFLPHSDNVCYCGYYTITTNSIQNQSYNSLNSTEENTWALNNTSWDEDQNNNILSNVERKL